MNSGSHREATPHAHDGERGRGALVPATIPREDLGCAVLLHRVQRRGRPELIWAQKRARADLLLPSATDHEHAEIEVRPEIQRRVQT